MVILRRVCVSMLRFASGALLQGQAPAPPSHQDEAFVIEQSRTTWRLEDDGTGRREEYVRIKAQSEAGVQQWGQVVLGYNAASERLDIPFVRVLKQDGKVVTTPSDAVQDLSSPVQRIAPVYTDFRQKHVTVQSFRPGDALEVRFVTTTHTALAPGQFWGEYAFNEDAIVLDEQLDLDLPAARKVSLKMRPGYEAQAKEADGRRVYHWAHSHTVRDELTDEARKQKALKAITDPERAPIRFTTFTDWAEVGRWFAGLERAARQATPEVRAKARELTAGRTSDLDKLEALYDYVSKNFRYVSLSLGVGRYQPRAAAEVLKDAYGDCKDKHTLLATLIDAAGFHASAVLINSGVKIDPDFPSPSQFDHVITRASAGGEDVWLDATPEVGPFRMLSQNLRHKQALLADAGGASRLVETPANPPMPALTRTEINATLSDAGALAADVKVALRGDFELMLRAVFRATPAPQWKDIVERLSNQGGMDGKVSALNVSDPQATKDPFTIAFHVESSGFAQLSGRNAQVDLPMGEAPTAQPLEGAPIDLGAPGTMLYALTLKLPSAVRARAPVDVAVSRDYGDYKATYSADGGVFTATRLLTLRQRELPETRRADYLAFSRVLQSDERQQLSVDASALASSATAAPGAEAKELSNRGWAALQAGDYETAIALLKKAVEADPKHPTAWTNLAISYISSKQPDPALAALRKQVDLNPYDEYAYYYMGRAYVMQHKYADAETAFNKQLEINPLDKYTPGALGAMYVEQRNYEKAAKAYEKWVAVNANDAGPHVQLGKAYMNLYRVDDARKEFNRAVELAPTPGTWNDVAYELSLAKVDLDTAQRYAESAVDAETAASRNLDVDHVDPRSLGVVTSLAAYWDTLGWVFFAKGDLTQAEKYVTASWKLAQHAEVGDHLGQIYEKLGRRADAIRLYANALAAENPARLVREHLVALAGGDAKADAVVAEHRGDLDAAQKLTLGVTGVAGKNADVALLLSAPNIVAATKLLGGDQELAPTIATLKALPIDGAFPNDGPARLLRRGALACSASGCTLTLVLPSDARPVR